MRNWEGRIAVKGTADPKDVAASIRGLRHLARLGKIAQAAIESIERDGFVEGRLPVIGTMYGSHAVEKVRFSRAVKVQRSMMPSFEDLRIELRDQGTGRHGGKEFRRAKVILTGTGCVHVQSDVGKRFYESRIEHMQIEAKIGHLRFKKNGPPSFDDDRQVHQVYEEFKWEGAQKYANAFTKCVSNAVSNVRMPNGSNYGAQQVSHYFERLDLQIIKDLETSTRDWLMREGHIERMSREMRESAKLFEVMSA